MKLPARLKLALSKERKTIEIKYNTFEKATYDQFLCASIALRAKNESEALDYIDDITGNGSLNIHFKQLYFEAAALTEKQLNDVMKSSMYPILKTDRSAWYDYFLELDISLYKNKIYKGDLANYEKDDIAQILTIKEDIIEQHFLLQRPEKKPQPYDVIIEDHSVSVKMGTEYISITPMLFEGVVVRELDSINAYKGAILLSPEGDGWQMLTNAALNNMLSGDRFFYEDGYHCLIRANDVRKTQVSKIAGLYFFKESSIPYKGHQALCKKVVEFLLKANELKSFGEKDALVLLENVDDITKRDAINYFLERRDFKEISKLGLNVILSGIVLGWKKSTLEILLKHANSIRELEAIYRIEPSAGFEPRQLAQLDKTILTEEHLKFVEEYLSNLEKQRESIKGIIGNVAAKSLRERAKKLVSDNETKRFSALCNKLLAHGEKDIDKADADELREWLKNAQELESLAKIIEQKLAKIEK